MYDFNQEAGIPFIIMGYVAGEDLKSFIQRSGKVTEEKRSLTNYRKVTTPERTN